MADKPETTEVQIAELTVMVAELTVMVAEMKQRHQVVSEFASMLAAALCIRKALDEDDVEDILRALRPPTPTPEVSLDQRRLSAVALHEVESLTSEYRQARSRM